MTFNRRTFMAGIGAAAGATLMSSHITGASAQTATPVPAKPASQVPGVYKTRVGDIGIATVFDGGMQMGEKILMKPDTSEVNRLKDKAFIKGEGIPGYLNTFLINRGGRLTLVDTGASDYAPTTGHAIENLAALGFAPDQINEIYLTHAHPDHVKGLVDKTGQPVFKNATVHISDIELKFWSDDTKKAAMPDKAAAFDAARNSLMPYKAGGRLETFKVNADMGGGITAVDLKGHTPGHTGFRISSGSEQLLIWGDIVHMQALQFAHPDWQLTFDIDPDQAVATRRKILDEVATDRIRIAGMHLCFPGIGHVEKSGAAYAFVPQMWESNPGQALKAESGTSE